METPAVGLEPTEGLESKLTCVALTLSHVSHMIRGRLQSMRNWLYVISRRPGEGPALAARVDAEIVELEARLEALMALPLALRPPRVEPTDLPGLTASVVGALGDAAQRVDVDPAAAVGRVSADPLQLRLALRALLTHALGGSSPQARVRVALAVRQDGVTVTVEHGGTGRPGSPEAVSLDPFGGPAGTGLGLDLGTAYSVARGHGGTLEIESVPGRGHRLTLGPLPMEAP